jgi:hypothetical protein
LKANPVQDWLVHAAAECGSPDKLLAAAARVMNENTRWLLIEYAKQWREGRRINGYREHKA